MTRGTCTRSWAMGLTPRVDTRENPYVVVVRENGMSRMPIPTPLEGANNIVELVNKETQTDELADHGLRSW